MDRFANYIGIPFEYGGRDRKSLDCYGLVMLIYKEIHNITLPDVDSPCFIPDIAKAIVAEKPKWTACELEEGCTILFSIKGYGSHVGYYIGNDRMIHTWEGTKGVVIERLSFSWQNRIVGIYKWQNNS